MMKDEAKADTVIAGFFDITRPMSHAASPPSPANNITNTLPLAVCTCERMHRYRYFTSVAKSQHEKESNRRNFHHRVKKNFDTDSTPLSGERDVTLRGPASQTPKHQRNGNPCQPRFCPLSHLPRAQANRCACVWHRLWLGWLPRDDAKGNFSYVRRMRNGGGSKQAGRDPESPTPPSAAVEKELNTLGYRQRRVGVCNVSIV